MAASLFCAEFFARALPVNMGLYRTKSSAAWPLHGYGPHLNYVYSLTWQMMFPNSGVTNNYGQVASYDFVLGSEPIVVIGDSFVESQMNQYSQTIQGRLNDRFTGRIPVYGFGFAGNSLAEYLALGRMARTEFVPVALVVVIIDNDVKESWVRRIGHRYFRIEKRNVSEEYWPLDQGGFAQRFRTSIGDSALYRYVQVNLGFSPDAVLRKHTPPPVKGGGAAEESESNSRIAVDYFLAHMAEASGLTADRIILVFDSDREMIYDPTRQPRKGVDSEIVQSYFKERARLLGYVVVDTEPLFAKHFAEHGRRFDFSPLDRHWNAVGHHVIATEVYRKLRPALCMIDLRLASSNCETADISLEAQQP